MRLLFFGTFVILLLFLAGCAKSPNSDLNEKKSDNEGCESCKMILATTLENLNSTESDLKKYDVLYEQKAAEIRKYQNQVACLLTTPDREESKCSITQTVEEETNPELKETLYDEKTVLNLLPSREKGLPIEFGILESQENEVGEPFVFGLTQSYSYKSDHGFVIIISLARDSTSAKTFFDEQVSKLKQKGGFEEISYVPSNCYGYKMDYEVSEVVMVMCYKNNAYIGIQAAGLGIDNSLKILIEYLT